MARVTAVKINPASGDDHAALLQDIGGEKRVVGTADKGEVFKVMGESNGFYTVQAKPKTENTPKGGTGSTGCCLAVPYTYLYDNPKKHKSYGRVNNGTGLEILELDDNNPGMFKVKCQTTNGIKTGYIEGRYIFRSCIEPSFREEG